MRRWLVAVALGMVTLAPNGSSPARAAVRPPGGQAELPLESLLERVQEHYRSLHDLKMRFRQRDVPRPGMPAREVEGTWYVRTPGQLRIEYDGSGRLLVADGETIYWYLPEDEQVQVFEQGASDPMTYPNLYLTGEGDLRRDFVVGGTEWEDLLAPGNVQIRLEPRVHDARFTHLILEVDPDTALIARLVQFGLLGETSDFQFHDAETDIGLASDLFRFTIPPGVTVEHLGN